jgi:tetratricopeptide (TPR) repeat protein
MSPLVSPAFIARKGIPPRTDRPPRSWVRIRRSGLVGLRWISENRKTDAQPVTEYADQLGLGVRDRIELFAQICDAVHHGHQKGVIHRDLKPANILVSADTGRPKIIDFGVARATDSDQAVTTLATSAGDLLGTLQYMSPEQCGTDAGAVDVRSDIYSLGVVLYELVCGQLPYDVRDAGVLEAVRRIREANPTPPSEVRPGFAGDLSTIVLKALEKEPDRRYGSAADLAADLRRFLSDEPISARPPNALYAFRKYCRRNRALVGAGAVVAALLIITTVVASVGWIRAVRAEAAVSREAKRAEEVKQIVTGMLLSVDPAEAQGTDITLLKRILDDTAQHLEQGDIDDERIAAELNEIIGQVYQSLGQYDKAEQFLSTALEGYSRSLGSKAPDTLMCMQYLAYVYVQQGRRDEAEALTIETLEARRVTLGTEHRDTIVSLSYLALICHRQGRWDRAEQLYLESLGLAREHLGERHFSTVGIMNNLALLYADQGRDDDAEGIYLELLDHHRRTQGEKHPSTLNVMNNLAMLYRRAGRVEEAEDRWLELIKLREEVNGEEHSDTLRAMNNLAVLYDKQRRYAEAEPLYVKVLQIERHVAGEEHPDTLSLMNNLANLYRHQDRYADAEALHMETLEIRRRVLGAEHPDTLASMNNLALVYWEQGRYADAEPLYEEALEIQRRVFGEEHLCLARSRWFAFLDHTYGGGGRDRRTGDRIRQPLADQFIQDHAE